jgi:integrase
MKESTRHRTKFYLEKRGKGVDMKTTDLPINVSVTFEANRLFYSSREKCNLDQWDEKAQRVVIDSESPNVKRLTEINHKLNNIEKAIDMLFDRYGDEDIKADPERLKDDLRRKFSDKSKTTKETVKLVPPSFFEYYRSYIDKLDLSLGRIKKHNTTLKKVLTFNPETTFELINSDYLDDFQAHLRKKGGKVKQYKNGKLVTANGKPVFKSAPLGKNTVISELKRFKAFLNWAYKRKLVKSPPFANFKIELERYGDPIFITTEERDKLFNAVIEDKRLERVRDMFVLQCYLGCRVGDFIKMTHANIIDGFIEYIAAKTSKNTVRIARVPITPKAMDIINRYDLPGGELVPYITDQKYNVYLKELFRLLEINRVVSIADPKTRQDKQVPICELVSSHMARRCFVGSLYKKSVKNEIIASMSGHAEGSKAFSRYHNIDKEQQQEAIKLIE